MPFSERSLEGWIMIDHRAGPGVDQDSLRAAGVNAPGVPGGAVYEAPTITCSHCGGAFIINPLRNRERARCSKCFHYLCDGCGAAYKQSLECLPFKAQADAAYGL
jgi:hypothetical protein